MGSKSAEVCSNFGSKSLGVCSNLGSNSPGVCSNSGSKSPQNNSVGFLKLGSYFSVMSELRSLKGSVY